jgi:hypothetical protein
MSCFVREEGEQTMKMRIPALLRTLITSGILSRGGSSIATSPTKVKPALACFIIPFSNCPEDVADVKLFAWFERTLRPRRITRLPSADHWFLISAIWRRILSSRTQVSPPFPVKCVHLSIRKSGAPLIVRSICSSGLNTFASTSGRARFKPSTVSFSLLPLS